MTSMSVMVIGASIRSGDQKYSDRLQKLSTCPGAGGKALTDDRM